MAVRRLEIAARLRVRCLVTGRKPHAPFRLCRRVAKRKFKRDADRISRRVGAKKISESSKTAAVEKR